MRRALQILTASIPPATQPLLLIFATFPPTAVPCSAMALRVVLAVAVLAVTLGAVSALYLPGVAPIDYEEEAEVRL